MSTETMGSGLGRLLDLRGRVAVVTGAGQGVGAATARMLAAQGAAVGVNDFHLDRAAHVAGELTAAGATAIPLGGDVSDAGDVSSFVGETMARLGPVDILVNNAGNAGARHDATGRVPVFWDAGTDEWDHWLAVNLRGVMLTTHAVVGGMVDRGWGRVVTVISDAGRVGEAGLIVYSAAKAGAAGFMRALAKAAGRHGVTANCVALGAVRTPAIEPLLADDERAARIARGYPVGRIGEPEDPAALITFLASDAAAWITGQTYPVNGGFSVTL